MSVDGPAPGCRAVLSWWTFNEFSAELATVRRKSAERLQGVSLYSGLGLVPAAGSGQMFCQADPMLANA